MGAASDSDAAPAFGDCDTWLIYPIAASHGCRTRVTVSRRRSQSARHNELKVGGLSMKAARAGVTALVLYGAWATLAHATCSGTSVSAFGAKGDGKTDDTAAIQSAISAAASAGGGGSFSTWRATTPPEHFFCQQA